MSLLDVKNLQVSYGGIQAVQGVQGNMWRSLMEQWTNQATLGTKITPPTQPLEHGAHQQAVCGVIVHQQHFELTPMHGRRGLRDPVIPCLVAWDRV